MKLYHLVEVDVVKEICQLSVLGGFVELRIKIRITIRIRIRIKNTIRYRIKLKIESSCRIEGRGDDVRKGT